MPMNSLVKQREEKQDNSTSKGVVSNNNYNNSPNQFAFHGFLIQWNHHAYSLRYFHKQLGFKS